MIISATTPGLTLNSHWCELVPGQAEMCILPGQAWNRAHLEGRLDQPSANHIKQNQGAGARVKRNGHGQAGLIDTDHRPRLVPASLLDPGLPGLGTCPHTQPRGWPQHLPLEVWSRKFCTKLISPAPILITQEHCIRVLSPERWDAYI